MSKKRDPAIPSEAQTSAHAARVLPLTPILLTGLSAAMCLLALFQWMELLVLRAGGSTVCGVNEVVNCQKVWDTGFAASIHRVLGVPVAGLGLVWGLTAFALSLAWTHQLLSGRTGAAQAAALKIVAIVGVLSIPIFGFVSFNAGAACLTCIATYALVLVFALVAWRLMPPPFLPASSSEWKGGLVWAAVVAVVAYFVLLGPGRATPHPGESGASLLSRVQKSEANATAPTTSSTPGPQTANASSDGGPASAGSTTAAPQRQMSDADLQVAGFLQELSRPEKQAVSNYLALYRRKLGEKVDAKVPAPRELLGPANAPVKLVEWVDIRCPHCKALNDAMHEIKRVVPEGLVSVEPRSFPLAQECNPHVQRPDPSNVSCTAARALVCLEGTKDFWKIRDALFAAQQSLTSVDRVLEIAAGGSTPRATLESCIRDPATEKKLAEDVAYAMKYNPQGTPILTLNGREVTAYPPLVYALVMTRGDASSPAFNTLPPPDLSLMAGE